MNQEKHHKRVFQQGQSEEGLVPTHSRSRFVLHESIEIPKVTFPGWRRKLLFQPKQANEPALISPAVKT